jgi:hypothetical protein
MIPRGLNATCARAPVSYCDTPVGGKAREHIAARCVPAIAHVNWRREPVASDTSPSRALAHVGRCRFPRVAVSIGAQSRSAAASGGGPSRSGPELCQELRPGRPEVLGDGTDAPGVFAPLGRKLGGINRGSQAEARCPKASADGLRLVRGRRIVLGFETNQTDDFSDQTQAFVPEKDGGGAALRIVDDHFFEDERQVHQRAEGSRPAYGANCEPNVRPPQSPLEPKSHRIIVSLNNGGTS